MKQISLDLDQVIAKALQAADPLQVPLLAWPMICGKQVASHATAISFAASVLTIEVPDDAWRNELQGLSARYLLRLNQICPCRIESIQFRTSNS